MTRLIHALDWQQWDEPHQAAVEEWFVDHEINHRAVYQVELYDSSVVVYQIELPVEHDARGDIKRRPPVIVEPLRPFPAAEEAA